MAAPYLHDRRASAEEAHARIALNPGAAAIGAVALAAVLFVLNNLGTLSGWMSPPPGYVPALLPRNTDFAQYLTWLRAFGESGTAIPNYHAAWGTEPALLNPVLWTIARSGRLLDIDLRACYFAFEFLFYIAAAAAFLFAIRTFLETRAERAGAIAAAVLAIPVFSLRLLPEMVASRGSLRGLPGLTDFVWWSSDGFFHGIQGSALVTFGTASVLAAFAFTARYLRSGKTSQLWLAAAVTFVSAIAHPFEVFAIVSAGSLAILAARHRLWHVLVLPAAGFAGVLPYAVNVMLHPWLRDAAAANSWKPYPPHALLLMLGLPMMLGLALAVPALRRLTSTDRLLLLWICSALAGVYLPRMPHSQHLLDGIHYAGAMLLVRTLAVSGVFSRLTGFARAAAVAAAALLLVLSLAAYAAYWRQGFLDGRAANPRLLYTTVAPREEILALDWLRQNASPDDLVLAPQGNAPHLATRPMHSFASHQVFSIAFERQRECRDLFFSGRLGGDAAQRLLDQYGVRYVVAPKGSPASRYLHSAVLRGSFESLDLLELPGAAMKPYGSGRDLACTPATDGAVTVP